MSEALSKSNDKGSTSVNLKKLDELDVGYHDFAPSIERSVRCTWALNMYIQHVYRVNLSDLLVQKIHNINEALGITVQSIDLNDYKHDFTSSETLNRLIEENEYPKFLWICGLDALKDSHFSGWLRSRLTVRAIRNLRVVFVVDSREDYMEVFCDRRARFYQSTMPLQINTCDSLYTESR
ncbi:hypothetical protein [Vibrio mediterranei]|uniref:Uncharacterized protein n=1 Tax=Vibrio mediterranei TaxID=689 RepID=A0AAN1KMR4_9VIBR|nr:hypothetical protein [Vibrio mediterranei]ASI89638.1 hypothetical protein BSZ05_07505 [Vibrio mediterranei]